MGDKNQGLFIEKNKQFLTGPVLEVGSRNYGNTQDFRSLIGISDYVGIDMSSGDGVDLVIDLTAPFDVVDEKLGWKRFNTILCFSVLEHCDNPFQMANTISRLLLPNGYLFVGVPFVWRVHGYPDDYWRFTPSGVRRLFPEISFDNAISNATTSRISCNMSLERDLYRINIDKRSCFNSMANAILYFFRKLGISREITDYPYLYPPVMLNMLGTKREILNG